MRAVLLGAALLIPSLAGADDGVIQVGLSAGSLASDALDPFASSFMLAPRVSYGLAHGMALEGVFAFHRGSTRYQGHPFTELEPRLDLYGSALPDGVVQPHFTAGFGLAHKTVAEDVAPIMPQGFVNGDTDFVFHMGAGLTALLTQDLAVRLDYGALINFGTERFVNHGDTFLGWELALGVTYGFGGKDTDDDGITDGSDACPSDAEDMDGFDDEDGCPDVDNDGDSILDTVDACPDQAEDLDDFEDDDGCPDADNDGDGILDAEDTCPVAAGVASAQGCPDADGDGLADDIDACPTAAGPDATHGCPDTDGDGVSDADDECVDVPGLTTGYGCGDGDGDGVPDGRDACPEEKAVPDALTKFSDGCDSDVYPIEGQVVFKQPIAFIVGTDSLGAESMPHLTALAKLLMAHEELVVKVQVHADAGQDATAARLLTELRAAALRQTLIDAGVPATRIGAKGFGGDSPAEGEPNERIVFKLIVVMPVARE